MGNLKSLGLKVFKKFAWGSSQRKQTNIERPIMMENNVANRRVLGENIER
jgi:hypothetical protein